MDHPVVSVIIPNYNHARYLEQRIESVLRQTNQNIEVVMLDDCSTDNSREIMESYRAHPLVKHIIYNELNSGSPFKQWEKGIALASGEWIWIAESDDYADYDFLETMLSSSSEHRTCGLLFCDSHIVTNNVVSNETFSSQRKARLGLNHWDNNYRNNGISELCDYVLPYGAIHNTSAVLFKRDILVKANAFDISLHYMGDKYAFVKVLALSDIGYVNKPMNYYRASPDSKPKHTTDYLDYFREHFLIFDWVSKNLKSVDWIKINQAIRRNSEFALFTGWRKRKIELVWELRSINSMLLLKILWFNFVRSLSKVISKR